MGALFWEERGWVVGGVCRLNGPTATVILSRYTVAFTLCCITFLRQFCDKLPHGTASEGPLRSLGGSEANFLELCFGWFPYGNFHTKATSKNFRPPSGNFRPNPPELPRSPSRSGSSEEAGRKIVLVFQYFGGVSQENRATPPPPERGPCSTNLFSS